jgi:aminoglycoside phosphotransferase family enzyme
MRTLQRNLILRLKENLQGFPYPVSNIKMEETHISWILLTGKYAYKIKKELKFGKVLDFSNLKLRKKYCQIEVTLNKVLCNEMYHGVVKIIEENGLPRFAELKQKGKPLEYAVKMQEIPQRYRMDVLLAQKKVNKKTIDKLVSILVRFHKKTPTNLKIKKFGQPRFLLKKIDENFRTLETLTKINPKLEQKLVSFIPENKSLFLRRIQQNKVRNIHGDLYLRNIFLIKNSKFYLYDRIEFNEELRSADVAEDVAHFSMDLDFNRRLDLRKYFLSQYLKKSQDFELESLVYFWMCYKACMRAKVSLFQAKNEPNKTKKKKLYTDAEQLFKLAESYMVFF